MGSGPSENNAIGNLVIQILADGEIASIEEGKEIIIDSVNLDYYNTNDKDIDKWQSKYDLFKSKIIRKSQI